MQHVEINIGKICNSKCLFCYDATLAPKNKKWISREEVEKELNYFFKKGFRSVDFVGGEPSIYPHIIEVIKKAKELGYRRIVIATNGKRFSDFSFAKKVIEAGLNRVTVSVHSSKKEVEDYLTTIPGSFEQKIKGIQNLIYFKNKNFFKYGLSLNPLIHRKNYQNLENLVIYFKKLGIDNFRFNFLRPEGKAYKNKKISVSFSEIKPYILRLINFNERVAKVWLNFGGIPFCMYPKIVIKTSYLFRKYVGELHDLPTEVVTFFIRNLAKTRQSFNWQEKKRNFLKTKLECCENCRFNGICEGIWKSYLETYGSGEFSKK